MSDEKVTKRLRLEGVKLIFKNFAGEERNFNRKGARNFCAILDRDLATKLEDEGWYVKWPKAGHEDQNPVIKININFNSPNKPRIVMITGDNKTSLDEESVEALDSAEIESADLICNPYNWKVRGETGVTPYLKDGYFNVIEDEFYNKYYDSPKEVDDDVPF